MKKYSRVLLKLSGEALAGDKQMGFDEETCLNVARQVKTLAEDGYEVSIVIGGGNFWRGRSSKTIDRTKADQIGMLATVMNCIYVSEIFRYVGLDTKIFTPFSCGSMTQLFSKDEVVNFMKKGGVAFLAGGTGHPYFSTDTATVLRAIELDCDIILMARNVDGVYDSDPKINPNAKKYDVISLQEVLDKKLGVIDLTAAVLSIDNKMPMLLFGLSEENSIVKAACGQSNGTTLTV
ncbi:uridylate kinase [Herbinix hemicellulosilytica]|uniref:Uridylate kinase n=1 Tax=Herbinix hemicellulosilytica TaxID=1564487 RepID=A0A0H5SHK1_HERHM|nr:UMP kinase [Herbinix hemicellulosilytica]RBP60830.1 uridylate kinase [Herbinix hemicellulosilytica]CRZ34525.1 Uridylate kinase [Herbinix hemicellulosilytica]